MKETPDYGTMDRDQIWLDAVELLNEHFTKEGYDVHYNSGEQALHIIDREPGNPKNRGGSRLVQIAHTTWRDLTQWPNGRPMNPVSKAGA